MFYRTWIKLILLLASKHKNFSWSNFATQHLHQFFQCNLNNKSSEFTFLSLGIDWNFRKTIINFYFRYNKNNKDFSFNYIHSFSGLATIWLISVSVLHPPSSRKRKLNYCTNVKTVSINFKCEKGRINH